MKLRATIRSENDGRMTLTQPFENLRRPFLQNAETKIYEPLPEVPNEGINKSADGHLFQALLGLTEVVKPQVSTSPLLDRKRS